MVISQDTKDIVDLISKLVIPILLFTFGLVIVRIVERQKSKASRESDFTKKWAEIFLDTSLEFINASDRFCSLLMQLQSQPPVNVQNKFLEEIWLLTLTMGEQGIRIERLASIAASQGKSVAIASSALQSALDTLLKNKKGQVESIKYLQLQFTTAVRKAHAEMLEIK